MVADGASGCLVGGVRGDAGGFDFGGQDKRAKGAGIGTRVVKMKQDGKTSGGHGEFPPSRRSPNAATQPSLGFDRKSNTELRRGKTRNR